MVRLAIQSANILSETQTAYLLAAPLHLMAIAQSDSRSTEPALSDSYHIKPLMHRARLAGIGRAILLTMETGGATPSTAKAYPATLISY